MKGNIMKNINKKIETMFNSNEKYKLFFLNKDKVSKRKLLIPIPLASGSMY